MTTHEMRLHDAELGYKSLEVEAERTLVLTIWTHRDDCYMGAYIELDADAETALLTLLKAREREREVRGG